MTIIFLHIGHACREQHHDRTFFSFSRVDYIESKFIAANFVYLWVVSLLLGLKLFSFATWLLHPPEEVPDHRTPHGDLIHAYVV